MNVLQYPYPLVQLTIESGILAIQKSDTMKEKLAEIKSERKRIIETLKKYDAFEVFESKANFVLFDACGAVQKNLFCTVEQGISIRKLGKIGNHDGCLRDNWNKRNELKILTCYS